MFALDFGITTLAARAKRDTFVPTNMTGLLAWYDPSDLPTLFQDAAMTVPVRTDGDPVGAILDKSGNGRTLKQTIAGERPRYRTASGRHWIETDGVANNLQGTFVLSSNPAFCFHTAQRILTNSGDDDYRVFELSSGNGALSGSFGTAGYAWRFNNGNNVFSMSVAGTDHIVSWERSAGTTYAQSRFYLDGIAQSAVSSGNGTSKPNVSGTTLSLFRSASPGSGRPLMRMYGTVICSENSDNERQHLVVFLERKMP